MDRLTAALLLSGSIGFQLWAQTTSPPPSTQSATAPASATHSTAASQPSQFPLDPFKEFSAITTGGPVPGTDDEIYIYRSGDLMRMEANEGKSFQITDLRKQETHGLAKSGCVEYKFAYVRAYPFSLSTPGNKFERVPVGKETVDGHVCQVEDIIVTLANSPAHPQFRLWEAEDLQGFPVKIETKMHRIIRYKNIVLGPQDPTLFIFPNQCQVMNREEKGSSPARGKPKAATPLGNSK